MAATDRLVGHWKLERSAAAAAVGAPKFDVGEVCACKNNNANININISCKLLCLC